MTEVYDSTLELFRAARAALGQASDLLDTGLDEIADEEPQPAAWTYPVGSDEFPVADWYCAQLHEWSQSNYYGHTGVDLNGDRANWGDIDRGQPVWAVTDGIIVDVGSSASWLGVVVQLVREGGKPLWLRYAHLAWDSITVDAGDIVRAGHHLGDLGDYGPGPTKGDHLHFDAARDSIWWPCYRTRSIYWIDPVPVLKAHLDPVVVDAMLEGGP